MKNRLTPTQITLKELPAEGREFHFTRESGELNQALEDVIGAGPYQVDLKITPQGNAFDLRGSIRTNMKLQCARCAGDFEQPISLNLHDFIVIDRPLAKGDQMGRVNHAHEWNAEGPDYVLLQSDVFNVGDYTHEAIALAEPMRPLCTPGAPEGCQNPEIKVERQWLSIGEGSSADSIRTNPFQVLEKIKLKS